MASEALEWAKVGVTLVASVSAVCVTAYFAFRQYEVAKAKLNLDLFKEREPIYQLVVSAIGKYVVNSEFEGSQEAAIAMREAIPRAEFLFNHEVATFMREAYLRMVTLDQWPREALKKLDPTDLASARREIKEARTWLALEGGSEQVALRFRPFLAVDARR